MISEPVKFVSHILNQWIHCARYVCAAPCDD